MNERIQELAERTTNSIGWCIPSENERWIEKFAELIVRECLNQCYHRGMNDELYEGQLKAAAYIEEHFGVKGD